jgi:hypothetical protein
MKKKFFFGILFSAILAINVISVSKTDISDLSLMSLMQRAQADPESGVDYTHGYLNNPQECIVTVGTITCIFIWVPGYGYVDWCWESTEDYAGTMNYCMYSGNPDTGCTYHECQKNE